MTLGQNQLGIVFTSNIQINAERDIELFLS